MSADGGAPIALSRLIALLPLRLPVPAGATSFRVDFQVQFGEPSNMDDDRLFLDEEVPDLSAHIDSYQVTAQDSRHPDGFTRLYILTLTVIPEPASGPLVMLGLALLHRVRSRR